MRRFGHFVAESNGPASKSYPYFRKRPERLACLVASFTTSHPHSVLFGYGVIKYEQEYEGTVQDQIVGVEPLEITRSKLYDIHAMEMGDTVQIKGNVGNAGFITNLPCHAGVAVLGLVDRDEIHPGYLADWPARLAGWNRNRIAVQDEIFATGQQRLAG